ncbi:MAG: NADH-quinone oxidoreductase subunit C [Candidatus Omnitrophica bacterium]|nr:NADH-quinone oxidoreductase subunit C [Candidatus Omnitrophota bacterium]
MTRSEVIKDLKKRFDEDILDIFDKTLTRVYIEIKPQAIVKVATYVFKNLGARFNIASGVDTFKHIEILYHFTFEDINLVVSFRVKLDKSKLEIDSLAPIFEGANWIEREIAEMLGVNFRGHPELKRLLLPDEWPQGVYPLRRDYQEWDDSSIRDRGL